jgi:hypothetical protein
MNLQSGDYLACIIGGELRHATFERYGRDGKVLVSVKGCTTQQRIALADVKRNLTDHLRKADQSIGPERGR